MQVQTEKNLLSGELSANGTETTKKGIAKSIVDEAVTTAKPIESFSSEVIDRESVLNGDNTGPIASLSSLFNSSPSTSSELQSEAYDQIVKGLEAEGFGDLTLDQRAGIEIATRFVSAGSEPSVAVVEQVEEPTESQGDLDNSFGEEGVDPSLAITPDANGELYNELSEDVQPDIEFSLQEDQLTASIQNPVQDGFQLKSPYTEGQGSGFGTEELKIIPDGNAFILSDNQFGLVDESDISFAALLSERFEDTRGSGLVASTADV